MVALLSLCSGIARADDTDKPMFSLNGFGSLGVTHSSERQADFTSNPLKPDGAGVNQSWSADVDSRLGAQLSVNLSKQLSAVVQVIAEQRYDNTYIPIVEWANVKYQVTPDFSVRVGRIALPLFLAAEYRKVGYAFPLARAPIEVYGTVPISNSDGVDASYRLHLGDVKTTIQSFYGGTDFKFKDGGSANARGLWGISNTTDYGSVSVRLSYLRSNLSVDLVRPLFDGFRQFGPQGAAIADRYDAQNTPVTAVSLGASYDPGNWFVTGEWGKLKTNSFLGDKTAWYASAGYRIGNFTPYLTYAQVKADSNTSDPGLNLAVLPPYLAGPAAGLNAGLNTVLGLVAVQTSTSVGVRWDFMKSAALKLQYDGIHPGTGSPGTLINPQPAYRSGGTANVWTAILDFVF